MSDQEQEFFHAKDAFCLANKFKDQINQKVWLDVIQPFIKNTAKQGKYYCTINIRDIKKQDINYDYLVEFGKSLGYKVNLERGVLEIQFHHFTMSR